MNTRIAIILLLWTALFTCCKPAHERSCLKAEGDYSVSVREVSPNLLRVNLHDDIHLVIIPDSINLLRIEGGENMTELVETLSTDTMLTIRNSSRCYFLRGFKHDVTAYLHTNTLHNLSLFGYGKVRTETPLTPPTVFRIDSWNSTGTVRMEFAGGIVYCGIHSGPADITLNGFAREGYFYNGSYGHIDAENMETAQVIFHSQGSGDITVWGRDLVAGELTSNGDLYYRGNPAKLEATSSGKGQIRKTTP